MKINKEYIEETGKDIYHSKCSNFYSNEYVWWLERKLSIHNQDRIESRIKRLPQIKTESDVDDFKERLKLFIDFTKNDIKELSLDEIIKMYKNISNFRKIYEWLEVDDFMYVLYKN